MLDMNRFRKALIVVTLVVAGYYLVGLLILYRTKDHQDAIRSLQNLGVMVNCEEDLLTKFFTLGSSYQGTAKSVSILNPLPNKDWVYDLNILLPTLEELYIRYTDDETISLLQPSKSLTFLDVFGYDISDDSIREIIKFENLEEITVQETSVTELGFTQLKSFENLQRLNVVKNGLLGVETRSELTQAIPALSIYQ